MINNLNIFDLNGAKLHQITTLQNIYLTFLYPISPNILKVTQKATLQCGGYAADVTMSISAYGCAPQAPLTAGSLKYRRSSMALYPSASSHYNDK